MKIGIIGAGNIGAALVRRLRALGHDVAFANSRGPASLEDLARDTGAHAVSVREAARGRDLVVVTIPQKKIEDLPEDLFASVPATVPIVDTGNYYPQQRDGAIRDIEDGMTESAWVAKTLGRPVIKTFNNIYAKHLLENGTPAGTHDRIALPVAGDDPAAKATVMALVDELGFDPVDAGTIAESWRQQPDSPCYGSDFPAEALRDALAAASPERKASWKATAQSPGGFDRPA